MDAKSLNTLVDGSMSDDGSTLVGGRPGSGSERQPVADRALFVADPATDPTAIVYAFEHDNPDDTRLFDAKGNVVYTASSKLEKHGVNRVSKVTDVVNQWGKRIAMHNQSLGLGSDTVSIGDQEPQKRSSWLSSGLPLTSTLGKFKHEGEAFKWSKKADQGNFTMEFFLDCKGSKKPVATYMDSRRDWNAPPNELVIKQARLEVLPDGSQYLDICFFSMIVLEQMRRAKFKESISANEAEGRGMVQSGLVLGNF